MHKIRLFLSFLMVLLLTGCQPHSLETPLSGENLQGTLPTPYAYEEKMLKPNSSEMDNLKSLQEQHFNAPWERKYTLSQQDVDDLLECARPDNPAMLVPYNSPGEITLTTGEIKVGASFILTGNYITTNPYPITGEHLDQLKKLGIGILPFNSEILTPSYTEDWGLYDQEEWMRRAGAIAGTNRWSWFEYTGYIERYPFNTLLVTNDLLLHVFHKIFSNELSYFEESHAREVLAKLSEAQFNHFLSLSKKEGQDAEKARFITAYRAIPYALLPDTQELKQLLEKRSQAEYENLSTPEDPTLEGELTDNELKKYLNLRFDKILAQVPESYQSSLQTTRSAIWKAEDKMLDPLLSTYSPEFIKEYAIQQDFTQFKPRSHYTKSSFLKTYFMASKWMMREKLYFGDQKLAEAALFMVKNLEKKTLKELITLQTFIDQMIGPTDDAGIPELQSFLHQRNGKTSLTHSDLDLLKKLKPQKLTSASYTAPTVGAITEDASKANLEGFVFFGEKFTIDSYIFELLTAGSASKEFLTLPNKQTSLIIPDVLEEYKPAQELVKLRLEQGVKHKKIKEKENCKIGTCRQASSYPEERNKAHTAVKKLLQETPLLKTFYHQRLSFLGQLFVPVKNAPYFKEIPLYVYKNLTTYLGSYTELKHDTLLYVKQVYAEMGAGGPGCSVTVMPPKLPVPKGYIEADVGLLDRMIALNTSLKSGFGDQDIFDGFGTYLAKLRTISLKQMKNQKISDEEFEWLRTSTKVLDDLLVPRKLFGEPSVKEERGALIADIFTAEGGDVLYQATGRPLMMAVMIKDINGARVVRGPIFSHYEFYQKDNILSGASRFSDEDWQSAYDSLPTKVEHKAQSLATQQMRNQLAQ